MVFKKVLVGDISFPLHQFGSQSSLVWSGRLPKYDLISFSDDQDNASEPRREAVQSLICIVDKQERARRRRPWTRSFNTSALKDYESLVKKRTLQLVDMLSSKCLDDAVDLKIWIDYFG
jgi:cytochrome P450